MTLLKNTGFEADWSTESSHRVHVFKPDGTDYLTDIGESHTPPSWTTWFYHDPGVYDQPEVGDAWKSVDPRRVMYGEKGVKFFTYYRAHCGGLYQQVAATPGQVLEFSAHCHAWSNHDGEGFPHKHDGLWSEGVGYDTVSIHEDNLPQLNGDPQNDAISNFAFRVGIDPRGGTDPFADSVVWSDRYSNYNGYLAPLVVEATAEASTVTVFVESACIFQFCHSDAYFDEASLEVISDPVDPPDDPPARQYERTVHLIPQDTTLNELFEVIDVAAPARQTISWSADDAFIDHPNLTARHVKVWGVERIAGDEFGMLEWVKTYYPPAPDVIVFHEFTTDAPPDPEPPEPPTAEPQYPYNPAPLVSIHMQGNYRGDVEFVNTLRPAVVKFCNAVERANSIDAGILTVGRFHRNNQDRYWKDVEPEVGAALYVDEIEGSLRGCPRLDYVESLNEFIDSGKPWQMHRVIRFEVAFCHELQSRGLPQKPVLLTAGIGNPYMQDESPLDENGLTDIEQMLPAVQACVDMDGALGYHSYWDYHSGQSYLGAAWQYHAGRALEGWDTVFRSHGLYPRYIFGECGICAHMAPMDGWRMVCNLEQYTAELVQYQKWLREWNALHGNRVIGATIFTCGGTSEWHDFEVGPYLDAIAAALR